MRKHLHTSFSYILILLTIGFFINCSGSSSSDPFAALPSESSTNDIIGTWALTSTITQTNCEEYYTGFDRYDTLSVLEDSCEFWQDSYTSDDGVITYTIECEAGGNMIAAKETMKGDDGSCYINEFMTGSATLNETTGELEGTFSASIVIQGNL